MAILQSDKGETSLMKVIALTILLLMLALIAFGSSLSRRQTTATHGTGLREWPLESDEATVVWSLRPQTSRQKLPDAACSPRAFPSPVIEVRTRC
jgi:hypothetical protein